VVDATLDEIDATLNQLCACGCKQWLDPYGPSGWFIDEQHQLHWHSLRHYRQQQRAEKTRESTRRRVCSWLTANGLDPMVIAMGYPIVTTDAVITVYEFVRDSDGSYVIVPDSLGGREPLTRPRTVPLVVPWPANLFYIDHYHMDTERG
jgi:hypothetical protein